MTLTVDVYWSFRSPYSYLATGRIVDMARRYDVDVRVRPVYPLAVRVKDYFKTIDPRWVKYVFIDMIRVAEQNAIPFGRPDPDPILMDFASGEVPEDQPHIYRLMRLGALAQERGEALAFADSVSRMIWSGTVSGWDQGTTFKDWVARDGFDLDAMEADVARDPARLDAIIEHNEADQQAAGHWGVPLMVFEGEPFFGQDRMDALLWRMRQKGLTARVG